METNNLSQLLYLLEIYMITGNGNSAPERYAEFYVSLDKATKCMNKKQKYDIVKFEVMLTEKDIDNMKKNSIITKP